jgi:hypothetical protein
MYLIPLLHVCIKCNEQQHVTSSVYPIHTASQASHLCTQTSSRWQNPPTISPPSPLPPPPCNNISVQVQGRAADSQAHFPRL